jgi:uncharacterized protein YdeI (YjbR/CyaY-like superfamily)
VSTSPKARSRNTRGAKPGAAADGAEARIVTFADADAWRRWLTSRHASSAGVWLKLAKKDAPDRSVKYAEALEIAIAWGWIDGQKRALDEHWWLQKFTPRASRSIWSKENRQKALALISAGKMMAPGLAEVERAKRDGRWDRAYDAPSKATVPIDLAEALASNPRAARFFEALDARNRYAVLFRVGTAKKPETRAKRIDTFVAMLARHEKLHP